MHVTCFRGRYYSGFTDVKISVVLSNDPIGTNMGGQFLAAAYAPLNDGIRINFSFILRHLSL